MWEEFESLFVQDQLLQGGGVLGWQGEGRMIIFPAGQLHWQLGPFVACFEGKRSTCRAFHIITWQLRGLLPSLLGWHPPALLCKLMV